MKTRIQPAGNLIEYAGGARNYRGELRPVPPQLLWGAPRELHRLLAELSPEVVRPRPARSPQRPFSRAPAGFAAHCQPRLLHVMNLYGEPHEQIIKHLGQIARLTLKFLLAGLPEQMFASFAYLHEKQHGSHPHLGIYRHDVVAQDWYVPGFELSLVDQFDRLVSHRFGFADPHDPAAWRVAYAGWASARPENKADIKEVCEAIAERFRQLGTGSGHGDLLGCCEDLGFPVLVAPRRGGLPHRTKEEMPASVSVPRYPNSVVIASRDRQRAILLRGPACRPDWDAKKYWFEQRCAGRALAQYRGELPRRRQAFAQELQQWIMTQRSRHGVQRDAIGLHDFKVILEEPALLPPARQAVTDQFTMMPPLIRWHEYDYPFQTDYDRALCAPSNEPDSDRAQQWWQCLERDWVKRELVEKEWRQEWRQRFEKREVRLGVQLLQAHRRRIARASQRPPIMGPSEASGRPVAAVIAAAPGDHPVTGAATGSAPAGGKLDADGGLPPANPLLLAPESAPANPDPVAGNPATPPDSRAENNPADRAPIAEPAGEADRAAAQAEMGPDAGPEAGKTAAGGSAASPPPRPPAPAAGTGPANPQSAAEEQQPNPAPKPTAPRRGLRIAKYSDEAVKADRQSLQERLKELRQIAPEYAAKFRLKLVASMPVSLVQLQGLAAFANCVAVALPNALPNRPELVRLYATLAALFTRLYYGAAENSLVLSGWEQELAILKDSDPTDSGADQSPPPPPPGDSGGPAPPPIGFD